MRGCGRRPGYSGPSAAATGTCSRQIGRAAAQRGWKGHPAGRFMALGTSPRRCTRWSTAPGSRHRNGADEGRGIVMARPREDLVDGADLDDAAEIHHRHMGGDETHRAQVVRDVQVGNTELVLQGRQQVQDLRPHGDVERRHRLVQQHHVRLHRQGAGDADALTLAAAEFVRVAHAVARLEPHPLQQGGDAAVPVALVLRGVHPKRLAQRLIDRPARVQRQVRILEHVLHAPAHGEHGGAVGSRQDRPDILPIEADFAGIGAHQIEDAAGGGGLAAAALADKTQGLARLQHEGDVVHRAHGAGLVPPEQVPRGRVSTAR